MNHNVMKNSDNRNADNYENQTQTSKNAIPVTPEMLQDAVRELETIRVYVDIDLIVDHLRQRYPVEKHREILKKEVDDKLRCAVCVGLIEKYDENKYCTPTLRKEANADKTALTAFWELYFNVIVHFWLSNSYYNFDIVKKHYNYLRTENEKIDDVEAQYKQYWTWGAKKIQNIYVNIAYCTLLIDNLMYRKTLLGICYDKC